jgi:peptide-methionine (R)-S-oxide reductase
MFTRRQLFWASASALALFAGARILARPSVSLAAETFPVTHSDAEWRAMLTPAQYSVLRMQGTERAFSSPLDHEQRAGLFSCAGCEQALFSSTTKYDSQTGWPSFWQPLKPSVIGTSDDTFLAMKRTEVHCSRCGGHLGHVFNDGPPPTGLRYCMNGVALTFRPAAA